MGDKMARPKLRKDERVDRDIFTGDRRIARTDLVTGKRRKKLTSLFKF